MNLQNQIKKGMISMYERHETGRIGEDISVKYLEQIGYTIIERNFECKQGEIDIIAKDKNEYVFIEVKTRSSVSYGKPKEAVDTTKKKHIYRSAEYYVYLKHLENEPVRIDVIEVYKKQGKFTVHHIKQAITERPYNK